MTATDRFAHVPGRYAGTHSVTRTPDAAARQRFLFLEGVPLLRGVDEEVVWQLAMAGADETHAPGTLVHAPEPGEARGSRPLRCYVLREGAAEVIDAEGEVTATLVPGDVFGDAGMVDELPDEAWVRISGLGDAVLVAYDAVGFVSAIAEHVLVARMQVAQSRLGLGREGTGPIRLRELGMFSGMPLRDVEMVLARSEEFHVPPGVAVVTQGEEGDRFYVVLEGECGVERDGDEIARIPRGDFFGEAALLFDCPRTATVRALRPTICWSIDRHAFEVVVRHYLLHADARRDSMLRRLGAA